ncbi:hypothetical protein [Sabulibacter ruber]|uniref:chryseobasin-related MNIO class RiPP peptide n=1 Tax=Sabulibacter ruber TaxID=2811901 RepID=UPI001A976882|nr:hypothetical protein [Sabulibacter ruber]
MNIPKSVLSAILLGITVQTTSCVDEENLPAPNTEQEANNAANLPSVPDNCPACGMG